MITMSELALVSISADANLYPVLAHLRFILGLINLQGLMIAAAALIGVLTRHVKGSLLLL